jgi:hypothetical protein
MEGDGLRKGKVPTGEPAQLDGWRTWYPADPLPGPTVPFSKTMLGIACMAILLMALGIAMSLGKNLMTFSLVFSFQGVIMSADFTIGLGEHCGKVPLFVNALKLTRHFIIATRLVLCYFIPALNRKH